MMLYYEQSLLQLQLLYSCMFIQLWIKLTITHYNMTAMHGGPNGKPFFCFYINLICEIWMSIPLVLPFYVALVWIQTNSRCFLCHYHQRSCTCSWNLLQLGHERDRPKNIKARLLWNVDLWLWLHTTGHKTCTKNYRLQRFMLQFHQICQICGKAKWVAKCWNDLLKQWNVLVRIHLGQTLKQSLIVLLFHLSCARHLP